MSEGHIRWGVATRDAFGKAISTTVEIGDGKPSAVIIQAGVDPDDPAQTNVEIAVSWPQIDTPEKVRELMIELTTSLSRSIDAGPTEEEF